MTIKKAYQRLILTVIFMMLTIIFYAIKVTKLTFSWTMTGFVIAIIIGILSVIASIYEYKHHPRPIEPFWSKWRFEILDWLTFLSVSMMTIFFIFTFFIIPAVVNKETPSMEPTLMRGDRVLVYHFMYEPKRHDVVVVERPGDIYYIKRIYAMPGDVIRFIESGVGDYFIQINGEFPKSPEDILYKCNFAGKEHMLLYIENERLKDGYYLVFGDNANNSADSRAESVGPIEHNKILGKAIFRLWPFGGIS